MPARIDATATADPAPASCSERGFRPAHHALQQHRARSTPAWGHRRRSRAQASLRGRGYSILLPQIADRLQIAPPAAVGGSPATAHCRPAGNVRRNGSSVHATGGNYAGPTPSLCEGTCERAAFRLCSSPRPRRNPLCMRAAPRLHRPPEAMRRALNAGDPVGQSTARSYVEKCSPSRRTNCWTTL